MFFCKGLICIIITSTLISCGAGKQVDAPAWYTDPARVDTGKLRFDGYYTNISEPNYPQTKYTAVNPAFFTSENKISVSHGANIGTDSSVFTCEYYKRIKPASLGKYIIEGNKISAFVPVSVATAGGTFYPIFNLYFTGTIANKELITNWKAVPPFPAKISKSVIEDPQNTGVFVEHDMKFIRADSVKCLNP